MNEVTTIDAVSVMEVEVFQGVPLWLFVLVILAYVIIVLLLVLIFWLGHARKEARRIVHHAPTSHDVALELQREILRSMRSSSRQNTLMIWLTILFITVSVVGGAVVTNFLQNIGDFGATWLGQFFDFLNTLLTQ
ncbi:MAG: hypothetical protein JW782_00460 [Candidatus Saganbacteria bacterium]|nr:hypothetical protein [Candidatus Saganbacteria bacterium]